MDGWTQQMGYPLIVFDQQNDTNIYTIKQERYYQAVSVSNFSSLYNTKYTHTFLFMYITKCLLRYQFRRRETLIFYKSKTFEYYVILAIRIYKHFYNLSLFKEKTFLQSIFYSWNMILLLFFWRNLLTFTRIWESLTMVTNNYHKSVWRMFWCLLFVKNSETCA